MSVFRAEKVVASLPETLEADTVYYVRTGEGFDVYVSDATGAVAHKLNADKDAVFAKAICDNLLINGHLRYDRYHFWTGASTQPLVLQRDIVADAVLYGWGGAPYDINGAPSNTLALEREVLPLGAVGRALKFVVDSAGPIDAVGDAAYHHHFRLIVPPERVSEIANEGGVYLQFKVNANHTATYSVTALNWSRSRGFTRELHVSDDGWQDVEFFYPLDNTELQNPGWLTEPTADGDGFGISFRILLGIRNDSPYLASSTDTWVQGNILGSQVDDFASIAANTIAFSDFRAGVSRNIQPKAPQVDEYEVLQYCYGHSSNDNNRSVACQVNTGWIAEFNFNPGVTFKKTPTRFFVLGQQSTDGGIDGDFRFRDFNDNKLTINMEYVLREGYPTRRFTFMRIQYPATGGPSVVGYNRQVRLRINDAASYTVDGVVLNGTDGFLLRTAPDAYEIRALSGSYATQQDFLDALVGVEGVTQAYVEDADIVLIAAHTGYNSFLRLEKFEVNDPTEGVINLLDGVTVNQVPPLTVTGQEYQMNLQLTRSDVSGELEGAKPLFYWDAVP